MNKRSVIFLLLSSSFIVAIGFAAAVLWQGAAPSQSGAAAAVSLAPPPAVAPSELDTLLPRDSIRAIDDPQFLAAGQVQDMDPTERLIGINFNGDARAYPLAILSAHEIVNDVVDGQPVAITWCPLCYSALVFGREVDGRRLSFGVSGQLLNNTLVMFDRQTDSLWSQLYGGAIDGPLTGRPLAVYPSLLTTWESWRAQNPEGQVLSKRHTCAQFDCGTYATNPRGSYAVDPYRSYYASADEGVVNRQIPRDELDARPKERVLGVRVAGTARAYPFRILAKERVVNDEIGGVPVVIWFDPQSEAAAAYRREVDGRVLSFVPDDAETTLLRDSESGARWDGATGERLDGPVPGRQLSALFYTPAFEFGWYGYFPQSDTYE